MEESGKEIRKLRKKLRQIHKLLTLTRELNEEEDEKVDRFEELQARLDALLSNSPQNQSSPDQYSTEVTLPEVLPDEEELHHEGEDRADGEEFQYEGEDREDGEDSIDEVDVQCDGDYGKEGPTPSKVARQELKSPIVSVVDSALKPPSSVSGKEKGMEKMKRKEKDMEKTKKKEKTKTKENETEKGMSASQGKSLSWWRRKPRYFVQELVGHSDIVLDVSIADGMVASASRDSLVKVWSTDTGLLDCTLSGHTEAAQACICVPQTVSAKLRSLLSLSTATRFVISGGMDSSILLWKVDTSLRSGSELRRLYVFTPVTCMALIPGDGSLVVAAGTSSGKIELWDVLSKSQTGCRAVHRSAVTSLRVVPSDSSAADRILSCSQGGEVAVHLIASLTPIFVVGDATPQPGRNPRVPISDASSVLAVGATDEWLLVGDGGSSLKMLRRGFKEIKKIPNSKSEFGACDGLWSVVEDGHQIAFSTAFDVDTGRGFLNVFNLSSPTQPSYLLSLQPKHFSGRYLCLDGERGESGDFPEVLVTGGIELLLWQRTKSDSDFNSAEITTGRAMSLYRRPEEEWSHAESEASSDEWSAAEEDEEEGKSTNNQGRWWCYIL